jgi:copper(I)-binding protein
MTHSSLFPVALALAIGAAAPTFAQESKAEDIVIEKPWARATPKGAEVGSGVRSPSSIYWDRCVGRLAD